MKRRKCRFLAALGMTAWCVDARGTAEFIAHVATAEPEEIARRIADEWRLGEMLDAFDG
jgi:hypothetical protein